MGDGFEAQGLAGGVVCGRNRRQGHASLNLESCLRGRGGYSIWLSVISFRGGNPDQLCRQAGGCQAVQEGQCP